MSGQVLAKWIAVDWGSSNLRVWAMAADGRVLDRRGSDGGMNRLAGAGFEPALLALVSDWLRPEGQTTVICCGMVGARQGWVEAPYRTAPVAVADGAALVPAPARDPRLRVLVAPGVKQDRPADVMRGEETQIAGFLHAQPNFDGVLCLPGTHSKWTRISAGELVSFTTYMTGELFALLADRSVLRHAVAGNGWDDSAFDSGLDAGLSAPARVAANLFTIRAESLIAGLGPESARAHLSGLLIGLELGAAKPYWLGMNVAILGDGRLAELYRQALAQQGLPAEIHSADAATLDGLRAMYAGQNGAEQT